MPSNGKYDTRKNSIISQFCIDYKYYKQTLCKILCCVLFNNLFRLLKYIFQKKLFTFIDGVCSGAHGSLLYSLLFISFSILCFFLFCVIRYLKVHIDFSLTLPDRPAIYNSDLGSFQQEQQRAQTKDLPSSQQQKVTISHIYDTKLIIHLHIVEGQQSIFILFGSFGLYIYHMLEILQ